MRSTQLPVLQCHNLCLPQLTLLNNLLVIKINATQSLCDMHNNLQGSSLRPTNRKNRGQPSDLGIKREGTLQ